ncbi:MAG: low molecular weight phosphotyrosine protein phosphatase [Gemmatimonadetes bacterium]|nr:low molecular weight phosphotyrosine protein phosphatase [Gemmatimonadota bacterium]NNF37813.1 low molecular weight phosphotyrosine protein phosphatase [Gemmatimonadota bacterium]
MNRPAPDPAPVSVLFVCLGNICRSPLAEGVFRHRVEQAELTAFFRIDSAGTGGWHVGDPPDPRSSATAASRGVSLDGQRARRVDPEDFGRFDWIVAMDRANLRDLERLRGRIAGAAAELVLLRDFDPEPGDGEVPDPYYGGPDGFDRVFDLVDRSTAALLAHLDPTR